MYLKFNDEYVRDIVEHEKRTTWRVDARKDILPGDPINLISDELGNFGSAEIVWVKHTSIEYLTDEDEKWHESYDNTEERLEALEEFYPDKSLLPTTAATVIRFELLNHRVPKDYNDS
jgi:hypothetical protein